MKILMLTGSPHVQGTTSVLAGRYEAGAAQAGHEIVRFDIPNMDVRPCIACDYCRTHENLCAQKDDMGDVYPHLLQADKVVLVTPLYYFSMTAQLKKAVDRFYAVNPQLMDQEKKFELLAACADGEGHVADALVRNFEIIGGYLGWKCLPPLIAYGNATREDIEGTAYPDMAGERGMAM